MSRHFSSLWYIAAIVLSSAVLVLVCYSIFVTYYGTNDHAKLLTIHKGTALFLIIRHAMPNVSYQWSSYTYYLFGKVPFYLSILSLANSLMATMGSTAYTRYVAPRFHGKIRIVFIVMTLLSASVSCLYLIPAHYYEGESTLSMFWIVLTIQIISGFVEELSFLPSVVLGTNSVQSAVVVATEENPAFLVRDLSENNLNIPDGEEDNVTRMSNFSNRTSAVAIEYGTYLACIDFGDQLGSWITVPLASFLGVKSRSDWSHLGHLIAICAGLNLTSLIFLCLLPRNGKDGDYNNAMSWCRRQYRKLNIL